MEHPPCVAHAVGRYIQIRYDESAGHFNNYAEKHGKDNLDGYTHAEYLPDRFCVARRFGHINIPHYRRRENTP